MTTYRERREYVHSLVEPVIEQLEQGRSGTSLEDWGETQEGWDRLDERIDRLRRELVEGEALDDWQDVGRRAREILLDVTQLVFRDEMVPPDSDMPREGDAKQRLAYYLNARVPGQQNSELRTLIKAAWDLANKVVHGNVARHHAFAAAQGAILVVRTLASIEVDADGP